MNETVKRNIPKPVPFTEVSYPEIESYKVTRQPSTMRVVETDLSGKQEIAIIFKRTYTFTHAKTCIPADEQAPINEDAVTHEEISPEVSPSFKFLSELVPFKTGTDLVVQASAMSRNPVTQMEVSVQVNKHLQQAIVYGDRHCDFVGAKLVFTPPAPFTELPLRYENAYGGRDTSFEKGVIEELEKMADKDELRKVRPAAEAVFGGYNPLAYPRNRFGKGYILEDRQEKIEGRALPNIERPGDTLDPERIRLDNPLNWYRQPVPVGFDYLDPGTFPRSAMLGLPPPVANNAPVPREVSIGLIPEDYCKGNMFATKPENWADLIHPMATRSASLGLWLPFLRGNETIVLSNMDLEHSQYLVSLPGERPEFNVPTLPPKAQDINAELFLVHVSMVEKKLYLVWVGRFPREKTFTPKDLLELEDQVSVKMKGV
ncbi:MAG: hypothetical protein DRH12_12225 [Deltaproteobacteria bacterium]|nr:MAG: hypothetical protein DRH12_12225 [Deltaproteobacteria bacterium]